MSVKVLYLLHYQYLNLLYINKEFLRYSTVFKVK